MQPAQQVLLDPSEGEDGAPAVDFLADEIHRPQRGEIHLDVRFHVENEPPDRLRLLIGRGDCARSAYRAGAPSASGPMAIAVMSAVVASGPIDNDVDEPRTGRNFDRCQQPCPARRVPPDRLPCVLSSRQG